MNKLQFKGGWNEVKGKLKQKYGQLSDNDLTFAEGKDEELLGRLQTRLGKSKEELRKEILLQLGAWCVTRLFKRFSGFPVQQKTAETLARILRLDPLR